MTKFIKNCNSLLISVIMIFITIFLFFMLNIFTPFWWDDFKMACYFTEWHGNHTQLLSSFSDIKDSTVNMYNTWHGRIFTNLFNFYFMYLKDKIFFNICNTIVYFIFILLINFHITGSFKKLTGTSFVFINICIWFFVSYWGQCLLWLTGSLNYLWTSTFILLFLIPFRKKAVDKFYKPHILVSVLWLFMGILAGCSMENSASGILILLLVYFIHLLYKKDKLSLFEITGLIGFLIGFIILLNSRNNIFPGFLIIIKNIFSIGFQFIINEALILGAIIIIAFDLVFIKKKKINIETYGYFIAALGSVAAMFMVGKYVDRSAFITQILLIITLISLLEQYKYIIQDKKYIFIASILIVLCFIPSFYNASREIVKSYVLYNARDYYIISEKNKGNMDIYVKSPIYVKDSHNAMFEGDRNDILADPSIHGYIGHNSARATWYGVNSINSIAPTRRKHVFPSIVEYNKLRKNNKFDFNEMYLVIYNNW